MKGKEFLMVFSDDDLKRLKETCKKHKGIVITSTYGEPSIKVEALLARLEAAEDCMQHNNCECEYCDQTTEAWRKACGNTSVSYLH